MNRHSVIWIILASLLIVAGLVVFMVVMTANGWDFSKITTSKFLTNEHEITEDFSKININTNTADVRLLPSGDGKCKVICVEEEKLRHTVTVKDGALTVEIKDEREWHEIIGINFQSSKIEVYLPKTEYQSLTVKSSTGDTGILKDFQFESVDINASTGDVVCEAKVLNSLKIKLSTGSITVKNTELGDTSLSVSTGDVQVEKVICEDLLVTVSTGKTKVSDLTCHNFTTDGSTGDVILENVIATQKFNIKRSTGDVKFTGCDAQEIYIKTETGDVKGSFLSEKTFIVNTETGNKNVPHTVSGGRCEISTDTGDIYITLVKN